MICPKDQQHVGDLISYESASRVQVRQVSSPINLGGSKSGVAPSGTHVHYGVHLRLLLDFTSLPAECKIQVHHGERNLGNDVESDS